MCQDTPSWSWLLVSVLPVQLQPPAGSLCSSEHFAGSVRPELLCVAVGAQRLAYPHNNGCNKKCAIFQSHLFCVVLIPKQVLIAPLALAMWWGPLLSSGVLGDMSCFLSTQLLMALHAWVWQKWIPVPGNSLGLVGSSGAAAEAVEA